MDADAVRDLGGLAKRRSCAVDEVAGISGKSGIVTGQLNCFSFTREGERVAEVDRMHDRFQLVEAIRTLAQDIEQEIDLAGGVEVKGHALPSNLVAADVRRRIRLALGSSASSRRRLLDFSSYQKYETGCR